MSNAPLVRLVGLGLGVHAELLEDDRAVLVGLGVARRNADGVVEDVKSLAVAATLHQAFGGGVSDFGGRTLQV